MTAIVNGLPATPHRRAFLRAVDRDRARIVRYRSTGEAWDQWEKVRVTARLEEAHRHAWVEPVPTEDLWPTAHGKDICTYYRLTDLGRTAMGDKR